MVEASEIVAGIWQGSKPPYGEAVAAHGFDMLVLCAREYQPANVYFPGVKVVHAPNDDNPVEYPFTEESLRTALRASHQAAEAHLEGKKILITCWAGLNRSGLVTALTLHRLFGLSGISAINLVRRNRGPQHGLQPLSNADFIRALRKLPSRWNVEGLVPISPTLVP